MENLHFTVKMLDIDDSNYSITSNCGRIDIVGEGVAEFARN